MHDSKFYRLGKLVYRLRWLIIGLWMIAILACLPCIPNIIAPFKTTGFVDENSQSAQTEDFINQKLGYDNQNKFLVIYHSKDLLATNALYQKRIKNSLSKLKDFPIKYDVILPDQNKQQISKDKHTAYAVIIIKSIEPMNDKLLDQFKSAITKPPNMTIELGGEPIFVENVNKQTQNDLYRADFIATPVALITLLFVFGSVCAALIPIILGGGCALLILTTLYFLGHLFTLSIFTLNIALLLGLCLCLDYCLFIISRFRDELKNGLNTQEAIAITQSTAGIAILFSGLAVFASLSALLLFPINILFSVAIGGLTAVFVAVLISILILPAILSVLGNQINLLPVKIFNKKKDGHSFNFWRWIAEKVVKRPLVYFISILCFLLLLGFPSLSAKFGVSDFRIFPINSEYRQSYDTYSSKFDKNELTPILLLVQTGKNKVLSRQNISKVYDLAHRLKQNPLVEEVNSIVTTNARLTKAKYQSLYNLPSHLLDNNIKQLLATTTAKYLTVMTIISKYPVNSHQTKTLVDDLRNIKASPGLNLQLTGTPVTNIDLLNTIARILPYAITWIIVFTYIILLILLRSIFLPFKAILMNILSLCACYGALMLVFQDGYLHQYLNFEPQGMLDISLLVIIFCALFGFSMDYEVFLLSRIKEAYEMSGDNEKSIIFGIEKSSRIITSAAIIVIFICLAFLVADVLMVKAFGLGIAVAIFVDAFLIRTILVPATMTLVKKWNWYLPNWLDKLLPRL